MRHRSISLLSAALLACLILGCSGGVEQGSPGEAVQTFYQHLNDGAYDDARSLYNQEALAVIEDPNFGSEEGYRDWARSETKQGLVERVEIVDTTLDEAGSSATVAFEVVYTDGTTKPAETVLLREDGAWKIGLIR